ncbi:neurensin-1-like [Mytilus galloprovincialis]|uniref:Neurensin-1 n=2 Tax=Mytilus TaxID=6548 RepID=A0A8B6HTS2_MYTGA|nr:unnamed protein product [Mytilus edulis]VDI84057.1 Hypothetical predicted protein [Mytilus galloprovincialis]
MSESTESKNFTDDGLAEEEHEILSKTSTVLEEADPEKKKKKSGCPVYFGVKSYLHEFYDPNSSVKDPSIYEEDDDFALLLNPRSRRRRCPPIWLKVCIWSGANLLLFGIVGILVGYTVPRKSMVTKLSEDQNLGYIDHSAVSFNTTLDLCKLVGLILFCSGGIIFAMSLLFPSFLTSYCDDDVSEDSIRIPIADEKTPLSPIEMSIPSTSKVKSVQPNRVAFKDDFPTKDVRFMD